MDRFPDSLIAFQRIFECPRCGHDHGWALRGKAHTFECARCHRQTSVTAGTILHGSKLALTVWFWAAYLMATHSNGIAALQLQKFPHDDACAAWLASVRWPEGFECPRCGITAGRYAARPTRSSARAAIARPR